VVSAIALSNFGSTDATEDWWEGAWSDRRGWPSAVVVIESRLSFTERGGIRASITDAPEDFDDTFEGDAGPIARSIGEGLFERIPWVLSLGRLVIGTLKSAANLAAIKVDGNNPLSVRSSSFDEPLTPTNFQIKSAAPAGAYIDRSRTRLMRLGFDLNESDYLAEDLSLATPNLCRGDKRMAQIAVQYRPDLTYHIRRDDGTVAILVHDKAENLLCWFEYETNGFVEDIYTKRAEEEDSVYYVIRRTINGSTVRYREKFALESECSGFPDAYLADAHYRYSGAATTTITGLGYLEGETVVVWGWNTDEPFTDDLGNTIGKDMGTFTVSGAQITGLPDEVTNACIGIGYTAQWKSGKQAFGAALGTAFTVKGKISHIGLIMADTHAQGIQYGRSFDELYDLPAIEQERTADPDRIWEEYDEPLHDFPMEWSTDERVCLQAASPRPCTILALVVQQTKNG
jgi:hypothetical protein